MRYPRMCPLWACLVALALTLPPVGQAAQYTLKAEVSEVLYYSGDQRAETKKVGTLAPVKITTTSESSDLDKLILEFCEFVQSYLSNLSKTRPPISVTLDDIQKRKTPAQIAVLYQTGARGEKRRELTRFDALDPTMAALDKSKVYAFYPLLEGYSCDLAHLAYANTKWVLQDENGKELRDIKCRSKKIQELERWVVEVKVENGDTAFQGSLSNAAYDAIDRLSSKYSMLDSVRKQTEMIAEEKRNSSPNAQRTFEQAQANFLLKLSAR